MKAPLSAQEDEEHTIQNHEIPTFVAHIQYSRMSKMKFIVTQEYHIFNI